MGCRLGSAVAGKLGSRMQSTMMKSDVVMSIRGFNSVISFSGGIKMGNKYQNVPKTGQRLINSGKIHPQLHLDVFLSSRDLQWR